MKKHFLVLLLMTLLPLAGWAQKDLSDGWEITFDPVSPQTYTGSNLLPTVKLKHTTEPEMTTGFNVVWTKDGEAVTEAINVGEYVATVSGDMTNTYGDLATPSKKFYILKATPTTITAGDVMADVAYDGNDHALVTTAPVYDFGTVEYSLDGESWSTVIPTGKKVAEYTVYVRVQGSDNYNAVASYLLGSPKITGADLEITDFTAPTQKTGLKFTNEAQALINEGVILDADHVKELQYKVGAGAWSTVIPTATNAGSYEVYYKAVGADGYNDKEEATPINVTIEASAPELTAPIAATSLTYTGETQNLISAAGTATLGAPVKYQVAFKAPGAGSYGAYGAAAEAAEAIAAGDYKVKAVVEAGGNYVAVESSEVEVSIAQANAFTVAPAAANLTWNNAAQQLITATPVKAGIVQYNVSGGSFTDDITTIVGTNAGDYAVKYKVVDPNYAGYNEEMTVANTKIAKKLLSVKIADKEKTYDGSATIPAAASEDFTFIGRLADGLDFSGLAFAATEKKNVGEYADEVTVALTTLEGISTNYEYTIIPGKLTINPVEVTITANTGLQITYGANPAIADEWTYSALVGGEGLADVFETNPVLTTDAAATKPAIGTYSLSFTPGVLKENGNYVIAENGYVIPDGADFKVVADGSAKIVITIMPQTHPYTGVAEDFTTLVAGKDYFVSGLMDDDEISGLTFARSNPETFNVGTYDLTASGATVTNADKYPGGIVYSNSTLEITPVELTATVNKQTVAKDAAVEALNQDAWSVEGLVNGEEKAVLGGSLDYTGAGSSAETDAEGIDGIVLTITNTNYTLKAGTELGKLVVVSATALVLDDNNADNLEKIKAVAGSEVPVSITFHRDQVVGSKTYTWAPQTWNTLVLPFDISVSDLSKALGYAIVNVINPDKTVDGEKGIEFYGALTMKGGNGDDEVLKANKPFIVKTVDGIADGTTINFGTKKIVEPADMTVDAGLGNTFVGTYDTKSVSKDDNGLIYFLGLDNNWKKVGTTSSTVWNVKPFAAYIQLTAAAGARGATFYMEELDGSTTAIRGVDIDSENTSVKNVEGWYTINGVKLDAAPTQKGIYINNGKKVVVK